MVRSWLRPFRPSCSGRRLLAVPAITFVLTSAAGCSRSIQSTLEPAGPMPGRIAKSLDYPSRKEFLDDYRRRTAWVRALYDRIVPAKTTRASDD